MSNINEIISDLKYARSQLLRTLEGLSQREITQLPVYDDWTLKDVLGHVLGWDLRVIKTLPLMLQHRASEIPGVEVEDFNRESVAAWRDKSLGEVLSKIKITHRQILEMLAPLDQLEIDMRRERHGRLITIRSYVIDVMVDHEREHAFEIEQWRKRQEQTINLPELQKTLVQAQTDFWAVLDGLDEPELLDPAAVVGWSIKDVVGHLTDWEQLMLAAARHIYDPSEPAVPSPVISMDEFNSQMVAARAGVSWSTERQRLRDCQRAWKDFVAKLKPGDCALRGTYPWHDQGTLAELITHVTEHYRDHLAEVERWRSQKLLERPPSKPWIRWTPDEAADGLLKKEYEAAEKRAGQVWHIVRVMSANPPALYGSMRLYSALVLRSTKMLGRIEREMIAVAAAQAAQCPYLIQAHLHDLRVHANDDNLIDRFAADWRTANLPAPIEAALAYAEKLTLTPRQMAQTDIRGLRRHGFADADIHDIVQIAAFYNYLSLVAHALGVPPEDFMIPWPREDGGW